MAGAGKASQTNEEEDPRNTREKAEPSGKLHKVGKVKKREEVSREVGKRKGWVNMYNYVRYKKTEGDQD